MIPSRRPLPFVAPDRTGEVSIAAFEHREPRHVLVEGRRVGPSWIDRAGRKRAEEFLAARRACRASLAAWNVTGPCEVGRNADGSPSWPPGFVGSVTHGGGLVACATARSHLYLSLGIDAEFVLGPEGGAEIESTVASRRELARLRAVVDESLRPALSTLVFSAKESFFKCMYPLVRERFGFDHAELAEARSAGDGTGDFSIRLVLPLGNRLPAGGLYRGRFALTSTCVQTAMAVRSKHGQVTM